MSDDSSPLKRCSKCQQLKPSSNLYFANDRSTSDLLTRQCKECRNAGQRNAYVKKVPQTFPAGFKRCSICKQLKPATLEYFTSNPTIKDGLRSECKPCHKIQESRNAYLKPHDIQMKYCPICQQTRLIEDFSRSKGRYDGHASRCKECVNRLYVLSHPKETLDSGIPPNHKQCTQCKQIKPLTDFSKQLNSYRSQCKKCVNANRQANRKNAREYANWRYKQNPENIRTQVRARKALKNSIPGSHTATQILEQLKRQHYCCYYAACGNAKFEKKDGKYIYHVEHTFPITRVIGTDIPANDMGYLVLACPHCNDSKGNKFPWEWPEGGRLL